MNIKTIHTIFGVTEYDFWEKIEGFPEEDYDEYDLHDELSMSTVIKIATRYYPDKVHLLELLEDDIKNQINFALIVFTNNLKDAAESYGLDIDFVRKATPSSLFY